MYYQFQIRLKEYNFYFPFASKQKNIYTLQADYIYKIDHLKDIKLIYFIDIVGNYFKNNLKFLSNPK